MSNLQSLLELAAETESAENLTNFILAALTAEVIVPINTLQKPPEESVADPSLLSAVFEGHPILPVFTTIEALQDWLGEENPVFTTKQFRTILELVRDECTIYLNPGAPVGREFSPWEITMLRQGRDAVPDLVAEILNEGPRTIGVTREDAKILWNKFVNHSVPIIESYTAVSEVFIVALDDEDDDELSLHENQLSDRLVPFVGIKTQELSTEKQQLLASELQELFHSLYPTTTNQLKVATDLGQNSNIYREFFREETPFYIRHGLVKTPLTTPGPKHWSARLFSILSKITSRRDGR